jgi:lipoprotein-anchoring transpeptidase ErfK/SrfK
VLYQCSNYDTVSSRTCESGCVSMGVGENDYCAAGGASDEGGGGFGCAAYASGGEKVVVIDLSEQRLIACQGARVAFDTTVSTGKAGFETPVGTFWVNTHIEGDQMVSDPTWGPSEAYDEWIPWVSYFTNEGHAIHQGYAGEPFASHGCVRVPSGTAESLWRWIELWTRVEIQW